MVDPAIRDALRNSLDQFLEEHPEAPSAVLLIETPEYSWRGVSGLSDPGAQVPMQPDHLLYIASVAKTMTATIALRLVEEGLLRLDRTLPAYLPAELLDGLHRFEGESYDDKITIRHLLGHTSGLPDSFGSPGFMDLIIQDPTRIWKPEDTVVFIKEQCTPHFAPGNGFSYSDVNYNLLGLAIESVTGKSLDDAYRRYLYEPLGLRSTYRRFIESPPAGTHTAEAHVFQGEIDFTQVPALTADWAGGGLNSTVDDLNRFLRAIARNEVFRDSSTREMMFQWMPWSGNAFYGLGVIRFDLDQDPDADCHGMGEMWGHIGASSCFMFYWPLADATLCGSFNQVACESATVPFVKAVLQIIRPI